MDNKEPTVHTITYKTQIIVWAGLIILTAATVVVARLRLGNLSTAAAVLIATVKATLVLSFFMHLRYEKRIFRLMFFIPIMTLLVILLLTFADIWYR